jgi:hypothetical protein
MPNPVARVQALPRPLAVVPEVLSTFSVQQAVLDLELVSEVASAEVQLLVMEAPLPVSELPMETSAMWGRGSLVSLVCLRFLKT